jgi:hypothetical protein
MRYENFYQNPIDGKDEDERIGWKRRKFRIY